MRYDVKIELLPDYFLQNNLVRVMRYDVNNKEVTRCDENSTVLQPQSDLSCN